MIVTNKKSCTVTNEVKISPNSLYAWNEKRLCTVTLETTGTVKDVLSQEFEETTTEEDGRVDSITEQADNVKLVLKFKKEKEIPKAVFLNKILAHKKFKKKNLEDSIKKCLANNFTEDQLKTIAKQQSLEFELLSTVDKSECVDSLFMKVNGKYYES